MCVCGGGVVAAVFVVFVVVAAVVVVVVVVFATGVKVAMSRSEEKAPKTKSNDLKFN